MKHKVVPVAGSLLLCVALTRPAAANAGDKAAAVAAFDTAEQLSREGRIEEACRKYEESQRLDPQLGTLLYLADCLEKLGKTASAWAAFRDAEELAARRGDPRQKVAAERISALSARLSRLQINVPSDLDPEALEIRRGNVVVGSALWNTPIPTDPGEHTITVSVRGREPWSTTAVVKDDGSTTAIDVELPERSASAAAPGTVAPAPPSPAPEPSAPRDAKPSAPRWTAIAAAGVGVVGIGVGSFFGLRSMSKANEADEHCDGSRCRDQAGVDLRQEALTAGNISTIAFIVGGVGLAAGATLWLVGTPKKEHSSLPVHVGIGPGSLQLRRQF